jgi:uncharacterized protein YjdB
VERLAADAGTKIYSITADFDWTMTSGMTEADLYKNSVAVAINNYGTPLQKIVGASGISADGVMKLPVVKTPNEEVKFALFTFDAGMVDKDKVRALQAPFLDLNSALLGHTNAILNGDVPIGKVTGKMALVKGNANIVSTNPLSKKVTILGFLDSATITAFNFAETDETGNYRMLLPATPNETAGRYYIVAIDSRNTAHIGFHDFITESKEIIVNFELDLNPIQVVVAPTEVALDIGQTGTLVAAVSGVSNKSVNWTSSNPAVATVSNVGVVTGVGVGVATITATSVVDSAKASSSLVSVKSPPPALTINPATVALVVNSTVQLTANIVNQANQAVTWSTSDDTLASVNANGLVTALKPGTTKITATRVATPGVSNSATITITPPPIGVTVSPGTVTINAGTTFQLSATVSNSSNQNVTWSSSDLNIATINATGLLSALAEGQVTITATSQADSSKSSLSIVTIKPPPPISVTISPSNATVGAGAAIQLAASISNSSNQNVTWKSSNTNLANVSATGLLTTIAEGQVTVTATSQADTSKSATAIVTINPPPPPISISVAPSAISLIVSETSQLVATVSNSANQAVNWVSSNSAIATVSTTGSVTAVAVGTVTITATSQADSSKSAVATIKIKNPVSITATPVSLSLTIGTSNQLGASVTNATNTSVIWESGNSGICNVDNTGLAHAIAVGNTNIVVKSVEDPTKTVTIPVSVNPPLGELTVNPANIAIVVNTTVQLSASIQNQTNQSVTWSTSDATLATVDGNGLVNALKIGTVQITATSVAVPSLSKTASITITPPPIGVSVSPSSTTVNAGATIQLGSTVANSSNQFVTWTSSNTNFATVSSSGLVTTFAEGLVTITATSQADTSKSATALITIQPPPPPISVLVSPSNATVDAGSTVQLVSTVSNSSNQNVTSRSSDHHSNQSSQWQ